jgi:putative ABC transport system permease protein
MPDWTEGLRQRLAPLRLSPSRESEIIEELSQHFDLRYEEFLESGAPHVEARRLALEELQGPDVLAQHMRMLRQAAVPPPIAAGAAHGSLIANLWQDLRYAARLLRQQPSFAVTAVLTLALGIGVNNIVFTVVNAVLIRGLPFDEPDRIVSLGTRDARDRDGGVSFKDYDDWRRSVRSFTGLAGFGTTVMNVSDRGRAPERYSGPYISANAFQLIGQRPLLGRDFTAQAKGEKFDFDAREKADASKPKTRASVFAEMEAAIAASYPLVKSKPRPQLIGWLEHQGEHYGKLVTAYRANGVVPPISRPKS